MISKLLLLKVMTFFLSFVLILLLNEKNEEITIIINYYKILFVYFGVFGVSFQQYFTIK